MDSSERRLDLDRRHDGLDVLVTLDDLVALDDLYALDDPVAHYGLNNLIELDDLDDLDVLDDLVSPDDLDDLVALDDLDDIVVAKNAIVAKSFFPKDQGCPDVRRCGLHVAVV